MPGLLLVMVGGAIGAGFRYHIGRVAFEQLGPAFPWGTWIVNILGGFLMGILTAIVVQDAEQAEPLRLFLGVGVLGGFTTFSAFSLETVNMLTRGDHVGAAAYAVSSVVGSVLALIAGFWLVRVAA